MTMPAGMYYIGDLCYVLGDEWGECCELFFAGRTDHCCNEGEFTLKDGRRFACFNTAYGDGEYYDGNGNRYSVDSGSIGCVRLCDLHQDFIGRGSCRGVIHQFDHDFEVSSHGGILNFGLVRIDTKYDEFGEICEFDDYDYQDDEF